MKAVNETGEGGSERVSAFATSSGWRPDGDDGETREAGTEVAGTMSESCFLFLWRRAARPERGGGRNEAEGRGVGDEVADAKEAGEERAGDAGSTKTRIWSSEERSREGREGGFLRDNVWRVGDDGGDSDSVVVAAVAKDIRRKGVRREEGMVRGSRWRL